jgi:hypothetical protein
VLFRSLRSLTGRALAAGAASALTLTLFNAAQPTLTNHQVHPGTLKDVKVALSPAPAPTAGPAAPASGPGATGGSGATGSAGSGGSAGAAGSAGLQARRGLWTAPRALLLGLLASPSGGPSPEPGG